MPIPIAPIPLLTRVYPPNVARDANLFAVALNAQSGQGTLVAGALTVTGVTLTTTSVIVVGRRTAGGTVGAGGLIAPAASRNVASKQFVIQSIDLVGALVNTDTSAIEWLVIG